MKDVFLEAMVARSPTPKILLMKAGLLAAALVVGFLPLILAFFGVPAITFMPITLLAAGWGFFQLNRRTNLEFEYIVTNGEMDVDKIMGRAARKRLLTVDCHSFDILAPMTEEHKREYTSQTIRVTIDASSGPDSPNRWFAVYPAKDGQRTLLIFEPTEKMVEAFRLYIRSKIKA